MQVKSMSEMTTPAGIIIPPGARLEPKEGIDFEYVTNDDGALTIRILRDDYKGIMYVYRYVALIPPAPPIPKDEFDDIDAKYNMVEEEEDTAKLKFDYVILENPNKYATKHVPGFEILLGDILSNILIDTVTNTDTKYTMLAKNAEGKIEKLHPIKPGKLRDKVMEVPTKTVGWSGLLQKTKRFIFGHE